MDTVEGRGSNAGKRRPGRPKKHIKKDRFLMVRMDAAMHLMIRAKALSAGMKPSEWFRRAAVNATVKPRFTATEIGLLKSFAGVANNLNQLTRKAHTLGLLSLIPALRALMDRIGGILGKLSSDDR